MAKPRPCKRCKAEIPADRLAAVPGTQLCVACSEQLGGEFEYRVTSENIAKTGSLKKNYGSWSLEKRRRQLRWEETAGE